MSNEDGWVIKALKDEDVLAMKELNDKDDDELGMKKERLVWNLKTNIVGWLSKWT